MATSSADNARAELTGLEKHLLAALWEINMAAERGSVVDPVWLLPNQIKHLADGAMGQHRAEAQRLAAERRG